MKLEDKVLKTIKTYNLIEPHDRIVIGVSGGPDSMTLLHVLHKLKDKLKIEIFVSHINHGLRKEADEETQFVQKTCENMEIPCYIKKMNILELAKEVKISTELAGRKARYDFFNKIAKEVNANKIATAHNANDNAETILMNLIRGSGTSGLKGIEKIRDKKYIRPIIECNRTEIEKYCKENKLNPRYDKSNNENIYTRNKIRNELIPFIEKKFNPNIIETLNRLSEIVAREEKYIVEVVEKEYQNLRINENNSENLEKGESSIITLDLKKFNKLDYVIKSRIILYTINRLLGDSQGIGKVHVEDIIKLCGNNIGNKYLIPNKRVKVFIKKGKIFFISVI